MRVRRKATGGQGRAARRFIRPDLPGARCSKPITTLALSGLLVLAEDPQRFLAGAAACAATPAPEDGVDPRFPPVSLLFCFSAHRRHVEQTRGGRQAGVRHAQHSHELVWEFARARSLVLAPYSRALQWLGATGSHVCQAKRVQLSRTMVGTNLRAAGTTSGPQSRPQSSLSPRWCAP